MASLQTDNNTNSLKQRMTQLMEIPGNQECIDCSTVKPTWAILIVPPPKTPSAIVVGAFTCYQCAGLQRGLGTHIGRVKSCNLDECTSFKRVFVVSHSRSCVYERKYISCARFHLIFSIIIGKEVEVRAMELGGNARVNAIFEATCVFEKVKPDAHHYYFCYYYYYFSRG
jgi:hypothetical protein